MKLTIIVLTYNSSKYVNYTLKSISDNKYLLQNKNNIQIVISDDNSNDDTVEKLIGWEKINKNIFNDIKIVKSNINTGTVRNFIRGIYASDGDIIKPLSGDDILPINNIFIYDCFKEFDAIFGLVFKFKDKQLNFSYRDFIYFHNNIRPNLRLPLRVLTFGHVASIYKKEIFTQKFLKELSEYILVEDLPIIYHLLLNYKIHYVYEPFILYRINSEGISKNRESRNFQIMKNDAFKFYSNFKQNHTVFSFSDRIQLEKKISELSNLQHPILQLNNIISRFDLSLMKAKYYLAMERFGYDSCLKKRYKDVSILIKSNQEYLNDFE